MNKMKKIVICMKINYLSIEIRKGNASKRTKSLKRINLNKR